jgi:hypothetical protein
MPAMIARSELRAFYEAVGMCSHIQILFLVKAFVGLATSVSNAPM